MAANDKRPFVLVLMAALLGVAGCAHFQAEIPRGFAKYDGTRTFKAASPDGVVFRVREVANDPYAELPFWREAVCTRMLNAGYTFVDSGHITAAGGPAALIELAAPLGSEDLSYLIAIIFGKKQLIIVEASGEVIRFRQRRADVVEAIKKIRIQS